MAFWSFFVNFVLSGHSGQLNRFMQFAQYMLMNHESCIHAKMCAYTSKLEIVSHSPSKRKKKNKVVSHWIVFDPISIISVPFQYMLIYLCRKLALLALGYIELICLSAWFLTPLWSHCILNSVLILYSFVWYCDSMGKNTNLKLQ